MIFRCLISQISPTRPAGYYKALLARMYSHKYPRFENYFSWEHLGVQALIRDQKEVPSCTIHSILTCMELGLKLQGVNDIYLRENEMEEDIVRTIIKFGPRRGHMFYNVYQTASFMFELGVPFRRVLSAETEGICYIQKLWRYRHHRPYTAAHLLSIIKKQPVVIALFGGANFDNPAEMGHCVVAIGWQKTHCGLYIECHNSWGEEFAKLWIDFHKCVNRYRMVIPLMNHYHYPIYGRPTRDLESRFWEIRQPLGSRPLFQPEDWDDEEDGEWTTPTIPNPEYKGPWKAKKIKNPNYSGKWKAPMIDNPDFKDDSDLYVFPNLKYVGIELWQVKSGTLIDNLLITDDPDYAKKLAEDTWGKQKDAEKAAFDEAENKREKEEAKADPVDSDAEEDDDDDSDADAKQDINEDIRNDDDRDVDVKDQL